MPATPLRELAAETGLTAHDAAYLWLVRSLRLDLVTFARSLAEAAATGRVGG